MAIKLTSISGYTKFINTKFLDDIVQPTEAPIDTVMLMGAYTEKEKEEVAKQWHKANAAKEAAEKAAKEAAKKAADAAALKAQIEAEEAAQSAALKALIEKEKEEAKFKDEFPRETRIADDEDAPEFEMGEAGTSDHMGPESGGTDPRGDRNGGSGEGMAGPANY